MFRAKVWIVTISQLSLEDSDMAYFFIASRLAAEFKGRFEAMGEEVTFDIEVPCIFNKWCNFG